jgi:hypothetical protein
VRLALKFFQQHSQELTVDKDYSTNTPAIEITQEDIADGE